MMCGFVSLVAPDALHTGNGCPHDQGPASAHVVVPPAPGADPAWYTEDELWYDAWGLPSLARPPADVAYGVASYVATGGAMHNFYMWHGGNHYGNWSTATPDLGGASSAENTARDRASSAPARGPRNRPRPRSATRTPRRCGATGAATSPSSPTSPRSTARSTPTRRCCSARRRRRSRHRRAPRPARTRAGQG